MTPEQRLLSQVAKTVFHLNGRLLDIAEHLAAPAGLTGARWQVLGTVVWTPMSVAAIARELGVTRQSVQRTADILVAQGLAEYLPNPSHRRAKLLNLTDRGREAVDRIRPGHAALAHQIADELGMEEFKHIAEAITRIATVLERVSPART